MALVYKVPIVLFCNFIGGTIIYKSIHSVLCMGFLFCVGGEQWSSCICSYSSADGYVVYYNTSTGSTSAVDVGNDTQYTLGGLVPQQNYTIEVRAYQGLLGPASAPTNEMEGDIK